MSENTQIREMMKDKKRIVIKIGSSSLQHVQTGDLDYTKLDVLVRELCDIRNRGKDVVLVTSGAVAVGRKAVMRQGIEQDDPTAVKQACAAIGQARLMMTYQKIFAEYNQVAAQILMTKNTIIDNLNRFNARNTFAELFKLGVVPIVNENDTVATYELGIGDNDTLSAIVAALIGADALILLSDIDGLYTDDPRCALYRGRRRPDRGTDGDGQGVHRKFFRHGRHEHEAAGGQDRRQYGRRYGDRKQCRH